MARVLVVDDDPLYRELVETMLIRGGHSVIGVDNGQKCLSKLGEESFDIVITDLFMPLRDGVETIVAIRGSGNATPIIGMTGGIAGAVRPYVGAMTRLGANAVLVKPFTVDELNQALMMVQS
ncbi:response regulator [Magnetospirillum fulvum]|uniref:Response regulator receiver domain-containing protein n=1 Tax=Magnetospirillum fulvum TaxID=1082 RepID=A0A1H6IXS7_MAGFU|nr:response regulator [Magnetospirillum fulvum]SEH51266.1 Response regulator receiver domain-containing protein [Magnetospirillum fulvum]